MNQAKMTRYTPEQLRRNAVEKMVLNYYNKSLYEKGMITEKEFLEMQKWIVTRKP